MIKKALTTVISAFYQHFDDYFCDGHLFDSILFICLAIGYKLMPNCINFLWTKYFFGLVAYKGQGANFKIWKGQGAKKKDGGSTLLNRHRQITGVSWPRAAAVSVKRTSRSFSITSSTSRRRPTWRPSRRPSRRPTRRRPTAGMRTRRARTAPRAARRRAAGRERKGKGREDEKTGKGAHRWEERERGTQMGRNGKGARKWEREEGTKMRRKGSRHTDEKKGRWAGRWEERERVTQMRRPGKGQADGKKWKGGTQMRKGRGQADERKGKGAGRWEREGGHADDRVWSRTTQPHRYRCVILAV